MASWIKIISIDFPVTLPTHYEDPMRSPARCYDTLRNYIQTIPIIDCHDHSKECGPKPVDPIQAVIDGYMRNDLVSASSDATRDFIYNHEIPLEKRWPVLEQAWKRTRHTGYAQVIRRAMWEFYGEQELTLPALQRIATRMMDFSDPTVFEAVLDKAGIVARLEDSWFDWKAFLNGSHKFPPRSKPVISLPGLHAVNNYSQVQAITAVLDRTVTSLDEYVETIREIFGKLKASGAVAFKDQSAYERTLEYSNPTRHQAEEAFNWIMEDPRRSLSYPDGVRPLDDFLFHQFMRMARDLDLPVQIHTGHMAGTRNEITKTNAVGLTRLIELHRETRFDLFHANWPYSGEILFLVKNYPNVAIDFCWTHMIDPLYSQALLRQAISSVPHGKIHGYGSDLGGDNLTSAWAHADLARENIAIALADLVEVEYLCIEDAQEIAYDWLFTNPNQFFKLGL
jgi:hypothetical protein